MKILAIRGRNLASLEGEFAVDFTVEPLCSAGIFAISGPTGAGKSTLLDAMCLALFGRTPRTDQAKENNVRLKDVKEDALLQSDPRFLLRRGTASGYAEVVFVALNGHRYQARWSVARARDREDGRLQQARMSLLDLDNQREEGGNRSDLLGRVVELIGLTFEQFTRSVLLAQNEFATFLKAEQGEKASLLEKLTGTEQYSVISRLIFMKNNEAKEAYERVRSRMEGIELLSEEEEKELRGRLKETDEVLEKLEKAKAERQSLQEEVRNTEQQLADKQRQKKDASGKLAYAMEQKEAARKAYEEGIACQRQLEERFQGLQSELKQARKLDVELEATERNVAEAAMRLKEAEDRKKEGEERLRGLEERKKAEEEEKVRLVAWREKYRSREGVAEQLPVLLIHLDAASAARSVMAEIDGVIAGIEKEAAGLAADIQKTEQAVAAKRKAIEEAEQQGRLLETELKEIDPVTIEAEADKVRAERERLLVEQARGDIRELRKRLKEGMPCPVCGSVHHPITSEAEASLFPEQAVPTLDVYKRHIDALTVRLHALKQQIDRHTVRQKELEGCKQRQWTLQQELTEYERQRLDLLGKQKVCAGKRQHEETNRQRQMEIVTKSLDAATLLFGKTAWQEHWQNDPVRFRNSLTDFARQWRDNDESLQDLERRRSAWTAEYDSFVSFARTVGMQYEVLRQEYEKKLSDRQVYVSDRKKLLSGRSVEEVEAEYQHSMETLKERLKELTAVQIEQSGLAEQMQGMAEQIDRDVQRFSGILVQQKEALYAWTKAYKEVMGEEVLDEAWNSANQRKTECVFRLRAQEENRRKRAGLESELKKRREASERWSKLNELAGSADGAKFRRIAQGYTLDILLRYTNVQLRMLTRRYRLERVPDTLALQVIDQDMCDEIRTVHSLSGGESFLISLALALGLSSLSSNRMKVESLFIDEGFGSLDAETLRVVMDVLENLRTQGRKIGVISHVQEMTERIPVQIKVNRANNGRSYLEVR